MHFSKAEAGDADAISALALETCRQFIFEDTPEEGRETLRQLYSSSSIRQRVLGGDSFVLAFDARELAGAAAMRSDDSHVYLFFVVGHFHRRGLGRKLMRALVSGLGDAGQVTLNSSMYAVEFYKRMGFKATGPVTIERGVKYLPMKLTL